MNNPFMVQNISQYNYNVSVLVALSSSSWYCIVEPDVYSESREGPYYRTRGNIDVKKTLTNLTNQTIRQYFFRQILAS